MGTVTVQIQRIKDVPSEGDGGSGGDGWRGKEEREGQREGQRESQRERLSERE